jgi:hypothetical protein
MTMQSYEVSGMGAVRLADDARPKLARAPAHHRASDHDPHGSSAVTVVPPPRGLLTSRRPSSASPRPASPRSPDPSVASSLAVVTDLGRRLVAAQPVLEQPELQRDADGTRSEALLWRER